jgi:chromate transporter
VVGLLFAALCRPLVATAIADAGDVAVVVVALALLAVVRLPPWAVVAACAAAGQLLV